MKIARDKTFERLRRKRASMHTHRVCEINKRHTAAEQMQASQRHVIEVSENIWKITSQHQDDVVYTVHHLLTSCECKVSCRSCNVCVHQYTCSCLDATIHATVCKHIHLIHMRSSNTLTKTARNQDSPITKTKWRSISLIPQHPESKRNVQQKLY